MARLPVPGSDNNTWGTILNDYLSVTLDTDGFPKNIGVIATKYVKPVAGIPESDLDAAVQAKLNNGAADATTTTKGIVQLAGDLAGTASAPTVPGLAGKLNAASNLSDVANAATAFSNIKQAATSSATGVVELADAAETTAGTDATRSVTPAGLATSNYGIEAVQLLVTNPNGASLTTGNGQAYIVIPNKLDGWKLVGPAAAVTTVSSSGNITIQIAKGSPAVDMLSTPITVLASQNSSYAGGTPQPVVDSAQAQVAKGNIIQVDVDAAGTNTKGLIVVLEFQKI